MGATDEAAFSTSTGGAGRETGSDSTGGGSILNRASALRDRAGSLKSEVDGTHHEARAQRLDELTSMISRQEPHEVLAELSGAFGLSWSTLSRLIAVSPTAVRKWRKGEAISADNRRALSRLRAFLDLLERNASPLQDVASWLEVRISDDATITAVDLYVADRIDLILDLASARISPHEALQAFDPEWRAKYASDTKFQVVRASDGMPAIVEAGQDT
jgi:hypothetical protein